MTVAATSAVQASALTERPPRPSATLVVVREAPQGFEVLLSRRAERGDHNSGAWVFPGGLVDAGDRDAHPCCFGLDDAAASARLGLEAGGLDYYIAAVRECFEESGLLYACGSSGGLLEVAESLAERLAPWRGALHRGERTLGEFCSTFGLTLAVDRLIYLSHWITPVGRAEALRHALLPRRRAAAADCRPRRHRDGRAALAASGRCAARERGTQAAHADAEDARAARALSRVSSRCSPGPAQTARSRSRRRASARVPRARVR